MSIEDRRAFLKKLGVVTPAALIADPEHGAGEPAPAEAISTQEIFETFVSEALHQFELRGWDISPTSTNNAVCEVVGVALALVLSKMQQKAAG